MAEKKLFLQWLLFASVLFALTIIGGQLRVFHYIQNADFTKISFAIIGILWVATLYCGHLAWRIGHLSSKENKDFSPEFYPVLKECEYRVEKIWFSADACEYLGLAGTILGFIFLFEKGYPYLQNINNETLQLLFGVVWNGAKTALVTTLAGIFAMLLIKIQCQNLDIILRRMQGK